MTKKDWRVVCGFNKSNQFLAYYVVRGKGIDPKKLEFTYHGAYILRSAAQSDCNYFNDPQNIIGIKYYRKVSPRAELVRVEDATILH